jgi:hypothetical protein
MASNQPAARSKKNPNPEVRTAMNWYIWLWFSPLFTYPTWAFLTILVYLITGADNLAAPLAVFPVLGSALWHLILLIPAFTASSEFVRWHGRQALLLAGLRTAIAMLATLTLNTSNAYVAFLVLLLFWLVGNLWGQGQAGRGDCALMRWTGRGANLPLAVVAGEPAAAIDSVQPAVGPDRSAAVDSLVETIRFESDPEKRRAALLELERLGLVEPLS